MSRDRKWKYVRMGAFLILSNKASAQVNTASGPPSVGEGSPNTGHLVQNENSRPYLLGDWDGERSRLAEQGVTFDFSFLTDQLANVTGREKSRYDMGALPCHRGH